MKPVSSGGRRVVLAFLILIAVALPASAERLSLKRAVDLAVSRSSSAQAVEVRRADASYREFRNYYLPQFVASSGLGASYGFPLALAGNAPSIVNLNAQSTLINLALRDYMRAAKTDIGAAKLDAQDARNQVVQDTATTYAELSKWQNLMGHLLEEQEGAARMERIVEERIQAGVDNALDRSKAQLATARVRYKLAEARGASDLLRKHLSTLTGLKADEIEVEPSSIPELPEVRQEDDLSSKAVGIDPAVEAAKTRARAQLFRARAEHRTIWPEVDFATQYALLSNFNNYATYYNNFQNNNASIGVAVRFPFLNFSQRAHAQIADADAVKFKNDAIGAANKVSEETLRLQRSVEQLAAAQQVADLQSQISSANFEAVQVKVNSGTGNLHDLQIARDDADQQFDALQDANFQLLKTRIALLRSTGGLESWIDQSK